MNSDQRDTVTDGKSPERAAVPSSRETGTPSRRRSPATLMVLTVCAALAFSGFIALGTWQVKRLHWKLDLIARVERRVHALPMPAPGPERWSRINAQSDEYRHVRVTGTFLYPRTTRVQASTNYGLGFWLLTPLRRADGTIVLVNRGFIPPEAGGAPGKTSSAASDVSTVTGLLRMSEPGGAFLHHNDPAHNRWYSRDVRAIAAARGLAHVAPYFIDADTAQEPANAQDDGSTTRPIGGLTVIAFHNNHLVYAFTWYALAAMVAIACFRVVREERRLPRRDSDAGGVNRDGEDGEKH